MEIRCFWTTSLRTNTYLVFNPLTKNGFLVDPGDAASALIGQIDTLGVRVEAILLTHGHYDHIGAVAQLQRKYGAKVYLNRADWDKIADTAYSHSFRGEAVAYFQPDVSPEEGDVIEAAGYRIRVMATPGHSAGGVCYLLDDSIFCGDTIFRDSYGRYDFADGSFSELKASILRLFALEGDYKLYCGHGEPSTLAYERVNNPILYDIDED